MKNWKKYLACLLAGVMMLAMLTACGGVGGISAGLSRATEDSTKDLCDTLNVKYSQELSNKAYVIANWLASLGTFTADAQGFSCAATASYEVKTDLQQERYASAFEHLGVGVLGADDITVGIDIGCDLETANDRIEFTVPVNSSVPAYMKSAAKGMTEMGAAYIVVGDTKYTVTVFR